MNARQFRIALLVLVVSGFVGGALANLLLTGGPAWAQAGPGRVTATEFQLVDSSGKLRARLGLDGDGVPALVVPAGYVDATEHRLTNRLGKTGGAFGYDRSGMPGLALRDPAGRERALMWIDGEGAGSLTIKDPTGRTVWSAP